MKEIVIYESLLPLTSNCVTALFHQPLRSAGGATNADSLDAFEPGGVYLLRSLDEVRVGIDTLTLVEEHFAVAALTTADKENEVVAGGKLRDVGHAVGDGATDGVEALEGGCGGDVRLDIVDDAMELVERLGGLRVEEDVACKIELLDVIKVFNDDGVACCLANQSQHFCVSFLAEDDNLSTSRVILFLDTLLQLQYHRTGCIDNLDVVTACQFVGGWGLTMSTQQYLYIVELCHLFMVDGDKPHLAQTVALHTVVNDIAQAVEGVTLGQLLLGLLDGGSHSEAEATAAVNLYL